MWTPGIVQAFVGDLEFRDDLAAEDGPRHDPGDVRDRHAAVPYPERIDRHDRPMLALVQAAGVVGSCEGAEARLFQLDLEGLAKLLPAVGVAASTPVAGLPDVAADEYVMSEDGHGSFDA